MSISFWERRRFGWKCSYSLIAILLLAGLELLQPRTSAAQQVGLPKFTLPQIESLIAHGVPDSTMSTQIQRRGISFTPTAAVLDELRKKGAGPMTLAAAQAAAVSTYDEHKQTNEQKAVSASPSASSGIPVSVITAENAALLRSKVLAQVQGNAYDINSTADGRTVSVLVIGAERGIYLFDVASGSQVGTCAPVQGGPYAISASAQVIAGLVNGGIRVCEPESPGVILDTPATSLALSPNGAFLASGRADGVVQLWNIASSSVLWTATAQAFRGRSYTAGDGVWRIAVTDDRQVAALYTKDKREIIETWNVSAGVNRQFELATGKYIRRLLFITANKVLASLGDTTWVLRTDTNKDGVTSFPFATDAISPDGSLGVSLGQYVEQGPGGYTPLTFWSLATSRPLVAKNEPGISVTATFSMDGSKLLCGRIDGKVVVWSIPTPEPGTNLSSGESSAKSFLVAPSAVKTISEPKASAQSPVEIPADVAASMLISKTNPFYPPIAKAARISGTVLLWALISTTGAVEKLQVISGPAMLQNSALNAVRNWRYRPYVVNNQPIEMQTTINVAYSLDR